MKVYLLLIVGCLSMIGCQSHRGCSGGSCGCQGGSCGGGGYGSGYGSAYAAPAVGGQVVGPGQSFVPVGGASGTR